MASVVLYDLDLEDDLSKVYQEAQDTIAYLQDLVKSISDRVLGGEEIKGLKVVEGRGTRVITEPGFKYLSKVLGGSVVYEEKRVPIGITKLEALIGKEDMEELAQNGYITYKPGSSKVVLDK